MRTHSWCLGLCAAMMLAACSESTVEEETATYPVATPLVIDTAYFDEYVADLNALQNVDVRARVNGFVENIHVDEGQAVKKGQVLFSISSREYAQAMLGAQAAVQSAEAELGAARLELTNTEGLLAKNIISAPELEMAKARLRAVEAQLAQARSEATRAELDLSYTEVKAPFDGIINRIPNRVGSLVEEGMLLTTISNNTGIFAYFNLSEEAYLDMVGADGSSRSNTVALVLANGATYPHTGMVETTDSQFDENTGNIAFRARFPNPDGLLKHGGTGKVRVRNPLAQAMLVPQKATFEVQGNIYVYVVDGEGVARMRVVEPSHRVDQDYVVADGLKAGERFLLEGIQRVRDGDQVLVEGAPVALAQKNTDTP